MVSAPPPRGSDLTGGGWGILVFTAFKRRHEIKDNYCLLWNCRLSVHTRSVPRHRQTSAVRDTYTLTCAVTYVVHNKYVYKTSVLFRKSFSLDACPINRPLQNKLHKLLIINCKFKQFDITITTETFNIIMLEIFIDYNRYNYEL